jgi:hypothetical protein
MTRQKWTYEQASAKLDKLARDGGKESDPRGWAEVMECLRFYESTEEFRRATAEVIRRDREIAGHLRDMWRDVAVAIAKNGDDAIVAAIEDPAVERGVAYAFMKKGLGGRRVLECALSSGDDELAWLAMGHPEITRADLEAISSDMNRSPFLRERASVRLFEGWRDKQVA